MIAQAILLALMLTGLAVMVLMLAGVAIVEWSARVHQKGGRGANAEPTPSESAEILLRELLDEREYRQLKERGYVDVASPNDPQRIYRIPSYAGLVRLYEGGWAVRELCLQSVEPLPSGDVVVMHKLLIQGNEPEYLARARQYARAGPRLRYHSGGGGASTLP
jgi:hypothetical protein